MRKFLALIVVISMILSLTVPAMAQNDEVTDDNITAIEETTEEEPGSEVTGEEESGEEESGEEESGEEPGEEEDEKEEKDGEGEELEDEEEEVSPSNPSIDLEVIAALELEITTDGFFLTADGMAFAEWLEYNEFTAAELISDMTVFVNEFDEYSYDYFLVSGELIETGEIVFSELEDGFPVGAYVLVIEAEVHSVAAYYFGEEVRLSFEVEGPMVRAFEGQVAYVNNAEDFDKALEDGAVSQIIVTGNISFNNARTINRDLQITGGIFNVAVGVRAFVVESDFVLNLENVELIGGGILLNSRSSLKMNDGSISGATAAGVGMAEGTSFEMTGTAKVHGNNTGENEGLGGVNMAADNTTLIMRDNAQIFENINGGVNVGGRTGHNSRLYMYDDASIHSHEDRGVHISNNASVVEMNNRATISNNIAQGAGGGIMINGGAPGGTVIMNDSALISKNESLTNSGGGINAGTGATIEMNDNAAVNDNTSRAAGGGIFVFTDASLIMRDNAAINGNTANNGTGNGGGGVAVRGTFTMEGGTVNENITNGVEGGGVQVNGGTFNMVGGEISLNKAARNGGGVSLINDAAFVLEGGSINNNTAGVGTTGSNISGGGVVMSGSGTTFTMSGGDISENTVPFESGHRGGGGGVSVNSGSFALSGSGEIHDNVAAGGGGVLIGTAGNFAMNGGTIRDNHALTTGNSFSQSEGGGIYTRAAIEINAGSVIQGNTSESWGGGIFIASTGSLIMNGGSIIENRSKTNSGGGVHVAVLDLGYATFTMNQGLISGNMASMHGGGVSVEARSTNGGPLVSSVFNMYNGEISDNTAGYDDAPNVWAHGGGVSNAGIFNMYNGVINGNKADRAGSNGGGVHTGGTFIMHSGSISGNSTTGTDNYYGLGGNGGGVSIVSGTFTMHNGSIDNNNANVDGGGVHIWDHSWEGRNISFTMNNGAITENTAGGWGGGIVSGRNVAGNVTTITLNDNASVDNNISKGSVGGVTVGHDSVLIMNGTASIDGNKAATWAGGVNVAATATVTMNSSSSISGNEAIEQIGGMWLQGSLEMNDNARIDNNETNGFRGGMLLSTNATLNMNGRSSVSGNTAANGSAGGIDVSGAEASLVMNDESSISGNEAGTFGGGLVVGASAGFTMNDNARITGNQAGTNGGGIFSSPNVVNVDVLLPTHYNNLISISEGAVFSGNFAGSGRYHSPDTTAIESRIPAMVGSVAGQNLINNYDINFQSDNPIVSQEFTVTVLSGGRGYAPAAPDNSFEEGIRVILVPGVAEEGYHFGGWVINSGLSADALNGSTFTMPENDVTVTATWIRNAVGEFTVTVLGGGIGFAPAAPDNVFEQGAEVTLAAGTRGAGYRFSGWLVDSGIDANAIESNVFTMPNNDVVIIAEWVSTGEPGPTNPTDPTDPTDPPTTTDPTDPPNVTEPPTVELPETTPPLADFPPTPTEPGNQLVQDGDVWIEIDEAGVPLGSWEWDDEEEVWIFDEAVPLSFMPRTGLESNFAVFGLGFIVSAVAAAFVALNIRRLRREA